MSTHTELYILILQALFTNAPVVFLITAALIAFVMMFRNQRQGFPWLPALLPSSLGCLVTAFRTSGTMHGLMTAGWVGPQSIQDRLLIDTSPAVAGAILSFALLGIALLIKSKQRLN